MGLAGRKVKQRIGADPRNLTWADNAAKFGSKYLENFGWDASAGQGLGVRGDGMTSHIKVAHKLDLMGIGANNAAKDGKDGIAWKQAREYEMLLMRLNQSGGGNAEGEGEGGSGGEERAEDGSSKENGFVKSGKKRKNETVDGEDAPKERTTEKKKQKTTSGDSNPIDEENAETKSVSKREETKEERKARKAEKKRRKEEKAAKKALKKAEDAGLVKKKKEKREGKKGKSREASPASSSSSSRSPSPKKSSSTSGASTSAVVYAPRPMAHRARFLASKRLVLSNTSAISEILGVASSSSSTTPSALPSSRATPVPPSGTVSPDTILSRPASGLGYGLGTGKLTSLAPDEEDEEGEPKMEKLMMATKSVAEYFAEKMAAKKVGKAAVNVDVDRVENVNVDEEPPRMGIGMGGMSGLTRPVENEDAPRAGLGSGLGFRGLGFSPASTTTGISLSPKDTKEDAATVEEDGAQKKNKEKQEKRKSKKEKSSS